MYHRVCAAIIRNNTILMVKHTEEKKVYWTLPGGGIAVDESPEEAVIREVEEETGLKAKICRLLYNIIFEEAGNPIAEKCFLLEIGEQMPMLGHDPEHNVNEQRLTGLSWFPVEKVLNDKQVALAMKAL